MHSKATLAASAMDVFWDKGFAATSMDDLVKATGVSRHGIYSDFAGKHDLFLASLETFREKIVAPRFSVVEEDGAGLEAIAAFFEIQIASAEKAGFPARGCFIANTMTEVAAHDATIKALVDQHHNKLRNGFRAALREEAPTAPDDILNSLADSLVVFAQGLWSASRVAENAEPLRTAAETFLQMIAKHLVPDRGGSPA